MMMSKYDNPEQICRALSIFILEVLEQSAAIRAYSNVFQQNKSDNIFLQRAHDSIWRELISELARIFDKSNTKAKLVSDDNCSLLKLKDLCLKEEYLPLFPGGETNNLVQSLDAVIQQYSALPIKKSRNKQLSHHDMKQLFAGKCVEISLDDIEILIADTSEVFTKIYNCYLFGWVEFSFPSYNVLVTKFEESLQTIVNQKY